MHVTGASIRLLPFFFSVAIFRPRTHHLTRRLISLATNHRYILLGCRTNFTVSLKGSTLFERLRAVRANRIVFDTSYHSQRHLSLQANTRRLGETLGEMNTLA